jgi:hypothetical protein
MKQRSKKMHRIYEELGLLGSNSKTIKIERVTKKYPYLKQTLKK